MLEDMQQNKITITCGNIAFVIKHIVQFEILQDLLQNGHSINLPKAFLKTSFASIT